MIGFIAIRAGRSFLFLRRFALGAWFAAIVQFVLLPPIFFLDGNIVGCAGNP